MNLHRLSVKYFVAEPARIDLERVAPVFHSWIQEKKLPGVLIDVADYRHVHQGPGVILIGHEADWGIDCLEGKPGLLHTQKRWASGDLALRLESLFRNAIAAMKLLEGEPALQGAFRFQAGRAEVSLLDRLQAPNEAKSFDALRDAVASAAAKVYGGRTAAVARVEGDPRSPLRLHVEIPGAPALGAL